MSTEQTKTEHTRDVTTETANPTDLRGPRDGSMTALSLGFFGAAWFSWASEGLPAFWSVPLAVGSVACLILAILGGIFAWRARGGPSAMNDPAAGRRFGRVVGATYAVIGVGVVALAAMGLTAYIAPWVAFVIGLHFWALAPVLQDRTLVPLAVVVMLISGVAVIVGLSSEVLPSAITGAGTGLALLAAAMHGLVRNRFR